ncbi:SusC/RagA family TonB-linked outer membrane protein [Danxiaibacter flavus]|uniref:SusC/RagA family TonB-linked outer membrane protein n=1 Tax=Danxiaibacter flavus TaxID=3049108 RepID=A0ABV3Z8U0_9BACT|nr:SusC/RagA family TonB-linked outer membrane protein [Chitinophagaceae bacterium DXS]
MNVACCIKNRHVNLFRQKKLYLLKKGLQFIACVTLLFFSNPGSPQSAVTITGTVKGPKNEKLHNASVNLKKTTIEATTNEEGFYSINVPNGKGTLVISMTGYETQEVNINGKSVLDITLEEGEKKLTEVVVVGYGTVQKKELTSSVTTVRNKDFLSGGINNPLQLIDGKVSGVVVSNPAAADPNRSTDIQVRGASSLKAGNGPLIIIDGMAGGEIRNLAQQDIESISILKDASAAAIYGSRGANGVVLIQTKKGKAGKVSMSYDGYVEHDAVAAKPDMLSPEEFLAHKRDQDLGASTNWYNELIRYNNVGQNHYLSLSGGNENSLFRISGNYRTKQAIDIVSDRKEYGLRANFLQKALNGLLEVGGNFSYRAVKEQYPYGGDDISYDAFKMAVKLNPTAPIMDPANPLNYNTFKGYDTYNPVQDLKTRDNNADRTYAIVDINFKLNILKNLYSELKLAHQSQTMNRHEYLSSKSAESVNGGFTGRARLKDENWKDYTVEWTSNYSTRAGKHDFKAMGGYSYQEFNNDGSWIQNRRFLSDAFTYNSIGQGDWGNGQAIRMDDVMSSWRSKEKVIAGLGRITYNFDETYYLTASARYEGNTKFGDDHKWGLFPAVSGAWRITKLPALQSVKNLDELKFRVSYGETGRSNFDRYTALAKYSGYGRYQNDQGQWIRVYGPGNNPNPNLQWEKAIAYNIGIDFSLFKSKLSGSIEAFDRKSKALISEYDVPVGPYPHEKMFVNVGTTSGKGLELNVNWNVLKTKNLAYSTNVIASYIKTKVQTWSNDQYHANYYYDQYLPSPGNPGPAYRLEPGVEIGSFYGYKYAGIDDKGNIQVWKDGIVGKEKIDATNEANADRDRVYLGHGAPHYELSWGNSLNYKNFDLSLYFRGRFNYKIINLYQMYFGLQAEPGVNLLKDAYTRNGQITSGKVICDYFLEPGDYFKLDNITLGWSPAIKSSVLKNLRIYGTVRNVFTITKYSGLDPTTVGVTGLTPGYGDLSVYPITRNFTLGAQINF